MSNLKDTDFDDLVRRASDKYPLRTDSADWDKMAAALEKDPTPSLTGDAEDSGRRRRRRFVWLLLLLPLAGAGYYTWQRVGHGVAHPGDVAVAGQSPASEKAMAKGNAAESRPAANAGPQVGNRPNSRVATESGGTAGLGESGTPAGRVKPGVTGTGEGLEARSGEGTETRLGERPVTKSGEGSVTKSGEGSVTRSGEGSVTRSGEGSVTRSGEGPVTRSGEGPETGTGGERVEGVGAEWAGDMELERIARDFHLSVNVTDPPAAKSTSKQKARAARSSYFYAGILGAPDISTVRMQSVKGVGTTFSALLGYAFNDRWSIETGAYLDRKKYYTDGEYFNTKNVRMPYNSELLNVNGTCNMWEIPLNVRYNLNPQGKMKWFLTAGLSTYLMSSEKYTYAYEKYTSSGNWASDSAWNIRRPSQYPFSIVNLSAGFEQRLGRVGNLRVEPYVRLPLTGIGTGKLPIMSGGVNIGITRRLW